MNARVSKFLNPGLAAYAVSIIRRKSSGLCSAVWDALGLSISWFGAGTLFMGIF